MGMGATPKAPEPRKNWIKKPGEEPRKVGCMSHLGQRGVAHVFILSSAGL